jgi:hypothetical protein
MDLGGDWQAEGSGEWPEVRCRFSWLLRDVSSYAELMGGAGRCVLMVVKAKLLEPGRFERLLWIQYTEALVDGQVYTPPPTADDPNPWPWVGIDRYPNTPHRKDHLPYVFLPEEQRQVDRGCAYGGRIQSLYDPGDSDTVYVDWASSGIPNWSHYSVLMLIGRDSAGDEWSIGSLAWYWSNDGRGQLSFGARLAMPGDLPAWTQCMSVNCSQYMTDTFRGPWPME